MKKICIVLLAMVFAIGMVMTAQASNIVNCKTTSEAIQKVGCEKAGSMSFTFDAGSVITEGDWWYADLPVGVTICKLIDYEIVNGAVNAHFATELAPDGGQITKGTVVVIQDIGGAEGNTVGISDTGAAGGIKFRVQGNVGSQRLLITVVSDIGAGVQQITVDDNAQFIIKILDGNRNVTWMYKKDITDPLYPAVPYDENLATPALASVDNTFCINAENLAGNYVVVSYDSKNDLFTFTGDNEVAHVMAANAITCAACKGATWDYISREVTQASACLFDYETPVGTRYCTTVSLWTGNKIIVSAVNPFDEASYQVRLTITSPATGVYWAGAVPGLNAYAAAGSPCPPVSGGAVIAPAWTAYKADTVTTVAPAALNSAGACTVPSTAMATILQSAAFGITTANAFVDLELDMPNLTFDTSVVQTGQTVTIKVELLKLPCGVLFECTRDIGIFTDACGAAVAAGMGNLVMPYFPPMDSASSAGWWAGFALYNNTSADGTATVTVYEQDGDSGTYDADVPAYGLFITLNDDLLALLTASAGNTGTLGDDQCYIYVQTDWATGATSLDRAGAFFMMGDGTQAQGGAVEANY